ncbi:hypothetical protein HPC49_24505 [Pyxidicoccus fallax]|uniref:Uncharacterized protein n=1 Tax=Pyxidicoccus fallax TaxID=394095 RepID=A0A848LJC4_9BACT|nr:hypothetical protein [Pyxidicoccus fallax]NMO17847.1 hypothetical protein [Pyxidicoccus fallax]NPC81379.1 hypothetical protein [Pyxidicoccus fallax]
MSQHRKSPPGPYRLTYTPEAREQCLRLPSRQRRTVERALARLAGTVGLRQWVSPVEAQEEFQVCFSQTLITYELDPALRSLVVKRLVSED